MMNKREALRGMSGQNYIIATWDKTDDIKIRYEGDTVDDLLFVINQLKIDALEYGIEELENKS